MVDLTLKAGQLISCTRGEYSDFDVIGFFVSLIEFKPLDELALYLEQKPEQQERYHFESDHFLGFLIQKGYLLEIKYEELYLGSYSNSYGSDGVRFRGQILAKP